MRAAGLLLLLCPLWACSSATAAPADGGTADGGAGAGSGGQVICAAVFDCAASCSDDPCGNACLALGSPDAQEAALALAKCFTDHACTDATCLQTRCQGEVDACLAQGKPVGTPLAEGTPSHGSVPPALAGSWVRAAYGETDRIKLAADGTGYYQSGLTSTGTCAVTESTTWSGTVVVDEATITVYATTVTSSRFECGAKSETTSPPQTLHFSYTYDASQDVLTAIESDCAAKYPDSPSSPLLYCKNAYARE